MHPTRTSSTNPQSWRAGVSSLVFHVVVLVALALLFTGQRSRGGGVEVERPGEIVLAQVTESTDAIEYQSAADTRPDAEAAEEQLPSALPQTFSLPLPGERPESDEPPMTDVDLSALDASQMTDSSIQNRNTTLGLSAEDLKQLAAEQKAMAALQPQGPKARTRLFSSGEIEGRRIVFVLDRSASMGGKGLGVLERAELELTRAVESLTEEHQFQIVAYHNQATMMEQRSMLPATAERKQRIRAFVAGLAAMGATQHEAGLYTALALQPDVIVLMTDGGYPPLNPGQVKAFCGAARGRVTVHTIQFGSVADPPYNDFMHRLASETGGRYSYFDVSQWRK